MMVPLLLRERSQIVGIHQQSPLLPEIHHKMIIGITLNIINKISIRK